MQGYVGIARAAEIVLGLLASGAPGKQAATFDIGWTSSVGYSLSGMLSFDDGFLGTGVIDETQIDSLSIEVFLNFVLQGDWDLAADGFDGAPDNFNLSFDTISVAFVTGGLSGGSAGQRWNAAAPLIGCGMNVGFVSGGAGQGVCIAGTAALESVLPAEESTLVASLRAVGGAVACDHTAPCCSAGGVWPDEPPDDVTRVHETNRHPCRRALLLKVDPSGNRL